MTFSFILLVVVPLVLLGILLLLLGIVTLLAFRLARHSSLTMIQSVLWMTAWYLTRIQWRAKIEGQFPDLGGSGSIIICNHRSSIDPFYFQTSVKEVMCWMVAAEYFKHGFFGWFLRKCEAIPVNRGGVDTASTKMAIRLAASGRMVGMFPEGRINTTDQLMRPIRPGAIVVALKAHVPVIPCYLEGSPFRGTEWSPFLMRANVRVCIGQPIDLSEYYGQHRDAEQVRKATRQCIQAITDLAGQPDFEPVFAGKKWNTDNVAANLD